MIERFIISAILVISCQGFADTKEDIVLLTPKRPLFSLCQGLQSRSSPSATFVSHYYELKQQKRYISIPITSLIHPMTPEQIKDQQWAYTRSALRAAEAAYLLPDFERKIEAGERLRQFEQLFAQIPEGYEIFHLSSDSGSGLKYMILRPGSNFSLPWILAVAGTETMTDWFSDLGLGSSQAQRFLKSSQLVIDCLLIDQNDNWSGGRTFIVTGHSLGGGLAQLVAYRLEARRAQLQLPKQKTFLVTWNAFGGESLVKALQNRSTSSSVLNNQEFLQRVYARHYWVPGDPISTIGVHLGPAHIIIDPYQTILTFNPVRTHSLETVRAIMDFCPNCVRMAPKQAPKERSMLSVIGQWLGPLSSGTQSFWRSTDQVEDQIAEALNLLILRWPRGLTPPPEMLKTFQYLETSALDVLRSRRSDAPESRRLRTILNQAQQTVGN